jgi:hypothetical protein
MKVKTKWGTVVAREKLTLTACIPRDECIEAWQFFNETVLPFFADRQIPYEINITDHYGELDDAGANRTAHQTGMNRARRYPRITEVTLWEEER